jgi:predicted RND superfamily exporter protein
VDLALRRPGRVLLVTLLLVAAGLYGLTQLRTSAAVRTITGTDSEAWRADRDVAATFGDEAIVVLVRESAGDLASTNDLQRLIGLEGCLAGSFPPEAEEIPGGPDGPCARLRERRAAKVVYGPATFVNTAANAFTETAQAQVQSGLAGAQQAAAEAQQAARRRGATSAEARRAGERAQQREIQKLTALAQQISQEYGIDPTQVSLANPQFVSRFLFDADAPAGTPKARFAAVLPNRDAALVTLRLREGLSDEDRRAVVALVREAVALDQFRLERGAGYVVSGAPVLVDAVAVELEHALLLLLAVGVLVMGIVLALTFPERRRLLPLGIALGTLAVVFGGTGLLGIPVNLGTIATLPVLLGLAVDYGVQLHARVEEQRRRGLRGPEAARRAVAAGGRPVLLAAGATLAGFLVLLLSPTPLVRGFALVLLVGVALAVLAAFTVGLTLHAALGHRVAAPPRSRDRPPRRLPRPLAAPARALVTLLRTLGRLVAAVVALARAAGARILRAARWIGGRLTPVGRVAARLLGPAGRLLAQPLRPVGRAIRRGALAAVREREPTPAPERGGIGGTTAVRRLVAFSHGRPVLVLVVGTVLALAGVVLGSREPVETDLQRLVPDDLPALRDLRTLERASGVSGELQVLVGADAVTAPSVLRWMGEARARILAAGDYRADRGCAAARLCPLGAPTDLLDPAQLRTQQAVDESLAALPAYFTGSTIAPDRDRALLSFGLRLGPLDRQRQLVGAVRDAIADPPEGVRATATGLPVLVADASGEVSSSTRRVLTLLGSLVLVGLLLVVATRSRRRGLVPLVPVAMAAGWSGLATWALGLPLNPLSVVLGALVVAIGTEFSVLLSERYHEERAAGQGSAMAIARTARSTGRAVGASAATAIAGFAVLAVSDIPLLRQFGLVTVLDLAVAVLAVVLVLPALAAIGARRKVAA